MEVPDTRYPGAGALPSELPPIAGTQRGGRRGRGAPRWVVGLVGALGVLAGTGLGLSDVFEFNQHVVEAGEDFPELQADLVAAQAELALSGVRDVRLVAYRVSGAGERVERGEVSITREPTCVAEGVRGGRGYRAGPGPEFGGSFGPPLLNGQGGTACDLLLRAGMLVTRLEETGTETASDGSALTRYEGALDPARAYVLERADRVGLVERRGLVPTTNRIDRSAYPDFVGLVAAAQPRVVLVLDAQGRPRRLEVVSTGKVASTREVVEYQLGASSSGTGTRSAAPQASAQPRSAQPRSAQPSATPGSG